ncbi:replication-associated recombination protein A [Candidatus Falkowbacteria bacterium]|nr:replication-associated recombination protein A [Candidatus Falkowbacteria bacterium]
MNKIPLTPFAKGGKTSPLADRMRPLTLEEFLGQDEIIGQGKMLRQAIESDKAPSMIFWGPPGSGKTTLAYIVAKHTKAEFIRFSAVTSGVKDLAAIRISDETVNMLALMSNGDARTALNVLEYAAGTSENISSQVIKEAFQKSYLFYDKDGEEHYNIISALHKSLRGSDANAALYWLSRMLEAGEDPLYIARRLVRFASEDVGLANSRALEQAVAAYQACHFMGMPECNVVLAQAVIYLAKCEKSNELYTAYNQAAADVRELGNLPVPLHIRNAPTKLMKDLNYGKDYKYSPNYGYKEKQEYLPDKLKGKKYLK